MLISKITEKIVNYPKYKERNIYFFCSRKPKAKKEKRVKFLFLATPIFKGKINEKIVKYPKNKERNTFLFSKAKGEKRKKSKVSISCHVNI